MARILIAGDFVPYNRVADLIKRAHFDKVLKEVRNVTAEVNYALVNLECPVVVSDANPIQKIGPNLKCGIETMGALRYAGFKGVTLANNHIKDFGEQGIIDTIKGLNDAGLDYVGAGRNEKEARKILYKTIDSQKIAFINCCENEFSIAKKNAAGAYHLVPVHMFYRIKEAKAKAQYVAVIVHGGHEHWQLPSLRMKETYRFFIDCGADVIINHHQHCYSGYETYNGKPIFYGLGNFCFDKGLGKFGDNWHYGYMVVLDFSQSVSFSIVPYTQCLEDPTLHLLPENAFEQEFERLNKIIENTEELSKRTKDYYEKSDIWANRFLSPVTNKFFRKLQNHHLLGWYISKTKLLELKLVLSCESHRDRLIQYIDNKLKQ